MKAIRLHFRAGPEALAFEDAPLPHPKSGELLVRVHAAAVTPTELEWSPTWTTETGGPRPFPIIMGHEFSGEVVGCGPGEAGIEEGDLVKGINDCFADGAQAEFCLARTEDIFAKPRSIDHAQAAVTPISALTAWQGLIERARLASAERVLIHGAAGGVGLFAVQLARWRGAKVIGTARAHNHEFVRGLGADEVVDYQKERFEDVVQPVDVIFDTVGGETLARSWKMLKPGGRLITVAASAEQTSDSRVRDAFFIVDPNRSQLEMLTGLIDAGKVQPVVGAVFPLENARQAYEHKPTRGKVVLKVAS